MNEKKINEPFHFHSWKLIHMFHVYVVSFSSVSWKQLLFTAFCSKHDVLNDITTFLFKPQFLSLTWRDDMIFDRFYLCSNTKTYFEENYFASYNIWYLLRTEKSSPLTFLRWTMAVNRHNLKTYSFVLSFYWKDVNILWLEICSK